MKSKTMFRRYLQQFCHRQPGAAQQLRSTARRRFTLDKAYFRYYKSSTQSETHGVMPSDMPIPVIIVLAILGIGVLVGLVVVRLSGDEEKSGSCEESCG
ncbi:hypothetical protein [Pseudomonas aeruginosa]|uniref:hypothetical protein n=1 Tax=Pseudomonas aeruginosa TaxID=287 RepID=UPI0021B1A59F|nr:hypothetical protein [Pseudomonas aeruginosa]MCT7418382.1 hypothetical protein [Pseudomonas aeruginosa]